MSKLLITVSFNEFDILYLLVSDTSKVLSLKYQLIFGTGSPVASQVKVLERVSFSNKSVTSSIISA